MAAASPDVIGRATLIADVLGQLRSPTPAVCLVGEPGVGKTTVWSACVRAIQASWSWTTSCIEAEQHIGLAVLADLFAATPDKAVESLPSPQRAVVDAVLMRTAAGSDTVNARSLGTTTAALLSAVGRDGVALVALDDLQYCDGPSLAAIRFAMRRIPPQAAAVLGARRPGLVGSLPGAREVTVDRLTPEQTAEVVRAHGFRRHPAAVARIAELSQGNAFYAIELARVTPDRQPDVQIPDSLTGLLRQRFSGLPSQVRQALLDLAIRGTSSSVDSRLDPAFDRGIVVTHGAGARFSHPLLAETALAMAKPTQLRAAYARAAAESSDPVDTAHYRALAASEPDESVATALDAAVPISLHRGDALGARNLAQLALALTPAGGRPLHRISALQLCETVLGNEAEANALVEEKAEFASGTKDRFAALIELAQRSSLPEAISHIEAALALDGLTPEDMLQANAVLAKAYFSALQLTHAERVLVDALTTFPDSAEAPTLSAFLAMVQRQAGRGYDAAALLRAVELDRLGRIHPSGSALEIAGMIATLDARFDEARNYFIEAVETSIRGGTLLTPIDFHISRLELTRGNLREARSAAERLRGRGSRDLAMLARICAYQGDLKLADEYLADAQGRAAQSPDRRTPIEINVSRAVVALLKDDTRTTWQLLDHFAVEMDALGITHPASRSQVHAVEAAAREGDLARANELRDGIRTRASGASRALGMAFAAFGTGHIELAYGNLPAASIAFGQAADLFNEIGMPLDQGRALVAQASALRRLRRRTAARASLVRAIAAFASAGADGLGREAAAELRRLDERRSPRDALTPAERNVAYLAAQGLRNAEIARTLQIAPKTVEHHLGSVYRKLEIGGRGQLATALKAG